MKSFIKHTILFVFLVINTLVFSQKENLKGYYIEGGEVVFIFKESDYKKVTSDTSGHQESLFDITVETVAVSGNFNNWSKDAWPMKKIDEHTYQLRKHLDDFMGEFSWDFKFIINNDYWAEPTHKDPNIGWAVKDNSNLHVYNLKLYTAFPDDNGNVRFRLRGYENAEKVIVTGTFNRWNEDLFRMYKIENGWEIILKLAPNDYQYKFIVDGNWMEDPTNPDKVLNEFGGYNSHIDVKKMTTFQLKGYNDANKVILAGSFNDWNEKELRMKKTSEGIWEYSLPLSGGKHHYKFIVDGEWIVDPNNTVKEYDGYGHINSVCMVR